MSFSIVVAADRNGGIGCKNSLPWQCPEDMRLFAKLTTTTRDPTKRNAVIMGRRTWESLGQTPLPRRRNLVVSSQQTLQQALDAAWQDWSVESVFVIGGAQLYAEAWTRPELERTYFTLIDAECRCDTFLPDSMKNALLHAQQPTPKIIRVVARPTEC
jgi:dihydrofolate reductase